MPDISLLATGAAACTVSAILWVVDRKAQRAHEAWCAKASRTEGVISRLGVSESLSRNEPTTDDDDRSYTVPVIRFRASDGVEYEIDAPGTPGAIGARVEVAYHPALPSSGRPANRARTPGCAIVLLVVGLALVAWAITH